MEYVVRLKIFEGPLDLLLHLIKKNEVDILDIPIAAITEQYLDYLEIMKTLNLDIAGEYLLLAATLAHIKSKMILPSAEIDEEDEEDGDDPRARLVQRLLEYKAYKEAASQLEQREILERDVFIRRYQDPDFLFDEDEGYVTEVSLFDLLEAFKKVAERKRLDETLEITVDRISLTDKIHDITERLAGGGLGFHELFEDLSSKREIIITFLALLEMIRLRMIKAFQTSFYGPIRIYPTPQEPASRSTPI